MTDPTKDAVSSSGPPAPSREPRPPSFRQAFAILADIRETAIKIRRERFKDKTPEDMIHLFAQLKRLKAVMQALEKQGDQAKQGSTQ